MLKPISAILRPYQARKHETMRHTLAQLRRSVCITQREKTFGIREAAFDRSKRKD